MPKDPKFAWKRLAEAGNFDEDRDVSSSQQVSRHQQIRGRQLWLYAGIKYQHGIATVLMRESAIWVLAQVCPS